VSERSEVDIVVAANVYHGTTHIDLHGGLVISSCTSVVRVVGMSLMYVAIKFRSSESIC